MIKSMSPYLVALSLSLSLTSVLVTPLHAQNLQSITLESSDLKIGDQVLVDASGKVMSEHRGWPQWLYGQAPSISLSQNHCRIEILKSIGQISKITTVKSTSGFGPAIHQLISVQFSEKGQEPCEMQFATMGMDSRYKHSSSKAFLVGMIEKTKTGYTSEIVKTSDGSQKDEQRIERDSCHENDDGYGCIIYNINLDLSDVAKEDRHRVVNGLANFAGRKFFLEKLSGAL